MSEDLLLLCGTAAAIGAGHTLLGPDHYVPFVAMAKAGRWSTARTLGVVLLCGVGHVAGSAVLGLLGIALGVGVFHLERIESLRGDIAGWLLLSFGLVYVIWGLRRAARNKPHTHPHVHADGTVHSHEHTHTADHAHVHAASNAVPTDPAHTASTAGAHAHSLPASPAWTPWVLFTVFVFGPCEPLIPLVMYPAARGHFSAVLWVTAAFGIATLATMTGVVLLIQLGVNHARANALERYSHALAGAAIAACGFAVTVLGL